MNKNKFNLLLTAGFILLCSPEGSATPEDFNQYFIQAARKAMPSVVNIVIYNKENSEQGSSYTKVADATGTIINPDGLLVTNYHVVSKGNYYQIITYNGSKYDAVKMDGSNIFLADIKTDIALLKIGNAKGETFTPLPVAANPLREGEWVMAIGNPYGLKQSITCGIVSSTGRDNVGFVDIEDFIQSDVSINPGSSGGPLINLAGEMVGINTAIRTVSGGYQGISFAIPTRIVTHVAEELRQYGRVRRGWLGLIARERPKSGAEEPASIVEVASVIKDSPADKAGVMAGDIVESADDVPITSLGKLMAVIGRKSVGSSVKLTVRRGDSSQQYVLPLREKEVSKQLSADIRSLFTGYGIEVDENTMSHNAVISYVAPDSRFADALAGDSIISLNGKVVNGMDELIRIFNESGKVINSMDVLRGNAAVELKAGPRRQSR